MRNWLSWFILPAIGTVMVLAVTGPYWIDAIEMLLLAAFALASRALFGTRD